MDAQFWATLGVGAVLLIYLSRIDAGISATNRRLGTIINDLTAIRGDDEDDEDDL